MTGSGDAAHASPLPLTAEGVTAAWLSAALRTRYAGVVITQVEPVQTIDGTATKVLLRLASGPHTRREGLPDQMCVKGGFGAYREYPGGMDLYASGDAHIGTPTSSPTGVGFVDWQTVAVGPWVHDVNYFLVSALDHAEVALTLIVRERHPQIGGKPQHLALVGDQPGRWGTLHPAALGLGQPGGGGWRAAQAR
jgi:hypothetical protein